ncbi:hypothetical protein QJS66_07355 [Kocuria rhizophila]|nr:hypothetical protein QJS66_07355 [Kocuria rhizophila]
MHPELKANDSPHPGGGRGGRQAAFSPLHLEKMYSLQDVFSTDELAAWLSAPRRQVAELPGARRSHGERGEIDGLAVNLLYRDRVVRT